MHSSRMRTVRSSTRLLGGGSAPEGGGGGMPGAGGGGGIPAYTEADPTLWTDRQV